MSIFSGESKSQTEVEPMRKDQVISWQNRYFNLMNQPFEQFPGQTYAEMDPLQRKSLDMQQQYARQLPGMVSPAMSAWQGTLTAPDVANNPYVQNMLEQQRQLLGRQFQEDVLPNITDLSIGMGGMGGSGQGIAEGIAARGMGETLARQAAATQLGAYGQGLQQQRFGLSAAPQMVGLGLEPSNILGQVGAAQRAEDQLAINEAMRRHKFEQQEPWNRLERWAGTYFPHTQAYGTTTAEEEFRPGALNIASQLGGLGLMGIGGYQALTNPELFYGGGRRYPGLDVAGSVRFGGR